MADSSVGEGDERRLTVYYDGACPICTTEVCFYRAQAGGEAIEWVNLQQAAEAELQGIDRGEALRRLHVRDEEGRVLEGVPAFAQILERLPRLSRWGRLMGVPPFSWIMRALYAAFLLVRPLAQRLARALGVKAETP